MKTKKSKPKQRTNWKQRAETFKRVMECWEETARQHCRNEVFYRDLITQIGEPFGIAAKTSDDGSVQQDVLALKVPELVAELRTRAESAEKHNALLLEEREAKVYRGTLRAEQIVENRPKPPTHWQRFKSWLSTNQNELLGGALILAILAGLGALLYWNR